tara:strand:+ start:6506 stop:7075 length:570 start_codon:yes stop_codon:yes gene_type:complete
MGSNEPCNHQRTLTKNLVLSKELLKNWQQRIHKHQSTLFQGIPNSHIQGSLFTKVEKSSTDEFEPLKLTPLPLSFWRWPEAPHYGPAIYLVIDRIEHCNSPILLYVGETMSADQRWKGEHDCKSYLAAYSEALANVGIKSQLSIRFWSDVPRNSKSRRKVEQELIQSWLPPFNKETRGHWNTPFTAQPK